MLEQVVGVREGQIEGRFLSRRRDTAGSSGPWFSNPDDARGDVGRGKEAAPSLLVDYDDAGRALGLEILAFDDATVARINEVLMSIGHSALAEEELAPLRAA